ncbi:MAG: inositol monophosphatase family protein [Ignavibacteriaceae bacterium]|nr:inositol monophosphatase family protein [Ignavibacteriaceae bacterium]
METGEIKNFMKLLAVESGAIVKKYFRQEIAIESKQDESPVTIADKKAEEVLRELIMKEFPAHGIIGEEFGTQNSDAEYKWILDPIDGTKSFISGTVTFGTLIALTKNDHPIAGVINQPVLGEFLFGDNLNCELNDRPVKMRGARELNECTLLSTDHLHFEKYRDPVKYNDLIHRVKLYRNWGDCYGYYLLATGYADIMIDPIMHVWDTMAVVPIIRGAGGELTDYYGNDVLKGDSVIAAQPEIINKVLEILNK